jgi:hypothetical protein
LSIEALSPFGFIVDRALVNLGWGFSNTGRVIMCGRMTPCNPNPDDIISISCDGVKLFEAPFSTFVQHSNYPYIYKLNQWNIHVGLDLRRGIISVIRTRIGLSGLDTSDGVDVELRRGNCTGEDNITLNNMMGRYWFYSKPIRGVKKLSAANVKTSSDTKRK